MIIYNSHNHYIVFTNCRVTLRNLENQLEYYPFVFILFTMKEFELRLLCVDFVNL